MSDLTGFVSRRRLLQISSLAPFAILAASGASHAQVVQSCKDLDNVPPATLDAIQNLAVADDPNVDKEHFRCVVKMLWYYYALGADPTSFSEALQLDILTAAYQKKNSKDEVSGKLIVQRLGAWDATGNHSATNICAFLCGQNTVEIAAKKKVAIDVKIFRLAWNKTELDMTVRLDRARSIAKAQGENPERARVGERLLGRARGDGDGGHPPEDDGEARGAGDGRRPPFDR